MIEPSARDVMLNEAMADPRVGAVLIDLVIGQGAHADPAGHVAEHLTDAVDAGPHVIASVTGTDADHQVRSAQVDRLERAGVLVAASNAEAAAFALACARASAGRAST